MAASRSPGQIVLLTCNGTWGSNSKHISMICAGGRRARYVFFEDVASMLALALGFTGVGWGGSGRSTGSARATLVGECGSSRSWTHLRRFGKADSPGAEGGLWRAWDCSYTAAVQFLSQDSQPHAPPRSAPVGRLRSTVLGRAYTHFSPHRGLAVALVVQPSASPSLLNSLGLSRCTLDARLAGKHLLYLL